MSLIGEFSDPEELGKLLQLVLGCAISCEKKQGMQVRSPQGTTRGNPPHPLSPGFTVPHLDSPEHIQRIMTLEESVQHVVMEAIQEVGGGA